MQIGVIPPPPTLAINCKLLGVNFLLTTGLDHRIRPLSADPKAQKILLSLNPCTLQLTNWPLTPSEILNKQSS